MTPDIAEVERVPAGILITFEDGRSAIYSTALMYELLPNDRTIAIECGPQSVGMSYNAQNRFKANPNN
jgi:hypothetical protein